MPAVFGLSRPALRPSVSRRDLIPELGIATVAVGATAAVHWLIVLRLGQNPMFLFLVTAAALTFWRGLGPGMLASSMGSSAGSTLYALSFNDAARPLEGLPAETLLMLAGTLSICWLIYTLRVDREKAQAVQVRRNDT